jgi:hypothetical protein
MPMAPSKGGIFNAFFYEVCKTGYCPQTDTFVPPTHLPAAQIAHMETI